MYKNKKLKAYIASPLFSMAELEFNLTLSYILEKKFNVYLPQRDGGLLSEYIKAGKDVSQASKEIFDLDIRAIEESDFVIAVLDGRAIDEGVSIELGYAYARKIKCFGLQTDSRRLMPYGNNPMVENVLEEVFSDLLELEHWINFRCDEVFASQYLKTLTFDRIKDITKPSSEH